MSRRRVRARRTSPPLVGFFLLLLVAGCAMGAGRAGTPMDEAPLRGGEVAAYTNVQAALDALRPGWTRRAREVFIDERLAGGVGVLRERSPEGIRYIELIPRSEVVRRFGPCQAPSGTGAVDGSRDPECGTRPVIHVVLFAMGE